jgi:hypothetical protein
MTLMLAATWFLSGSAVGAAISCDTFALEVDAAGRLVSLRDTASGVEYAIAGEPFCEVDTPGGTLAPASASLSEDQATFLFAGGMRLTYDVERGPSHLLFRLREMVGVAEAGATAVRHCRLRLTGLGSVADPMNAYLGDSYAVALMGTEVGVHGYPIALAKSGDTPRGAELRAETGPAHGLTPAGFGIVAAPRERFEAAIADFEVAAGLPSPRPGGVWAKASPMSRESYLFISGLREQDTDDVIRWAKRGGFSTVLIGSSWSKSHGHHAINTAFFPQGLPSLQRACDKLHAAGLAVGLHFLAAAVYTDDPYVTPVPDPNLVVDTTGTLAAPVDEAADFLPLEAPPTDFPTEDGGYAGKGTFVRVGDEIIGYGEVHTTPPYGLARCTRGAIGTKAAGHAAGARAAHLLRSYGYFLFDLDSPLAGEVVGNVCRVANAVQADMLYFDGSERLQGDHWYYNAKLQNLYYRGLTNRDTFLQGSSYSHYSWHLIRRMASADGHGDLKGYLDERLPALRSYATNCMPADIGWYYVYDPSVTADQFDYVLQKCLGFGASVSVQTNPTQLATHPEIGAIFDLVADYERLRLSGAVPETTRALLREPKREYRLLRDPLRLRRTAFGEWQTVAALPTKLAVEPLAEGARLGFQLRCGALAGPGQAYRGKGAVSLEDFEDLTPYAPREGGGRPVRDIGPGEAGVTSPGVTQAFASVAGEGPEGAHCGRLTATSTRADDGGWSCIVRNYRAALDLSWHKGIGFWLRGDGQGGAFKLQIRDGTHATDYYVTNNFTEWRYFQMPRPERPQPEPVDYSHITQLLLYYNGLPGGKTVTCWVDDVRALPELDVAEVRNPSLSVGGHQIAFPVAIAQGERLVYFPGEEPFVIPAAAGPRRLCAAVPDLPLAGPDVAVVSTDGPAAAEVDVRWVQDLPEEIPLPK